MNADSLTIRRVVPIVLFSMLFVLAVRQSVSIDPDLWWHLKAGQQIIDTAASSTRMITRSRNKAASGSPMNGFQK
jgi:hypothetical protein